MVKQEDILSGTTILGVAGNYGIPNSNYATVTTSVVSSLTPTTETFTSTGYSLEDIWKLVQTENSATSSPGSHSFPVVSAPEASMHTTSEVYTAITSLISYLNTNKNKFVGTILGVTGTYNPVTDLRVGMVGYWPFNEISGAVVSDYSGNENNGTWMAGCAPDDYIFNTCAPYSADLYDTGKVELGQAGVFDATSYVDLGNSSSIKLSSPLTYSGWVYRNSDSDGLVVGSDSGGNYLGVSAGGSLNLGSIGVTLGPLSQDVVGIGAWHFVAVTYDSSNNVTFYIDGVPDSGGPQLFESTFDAGHLYIGAYDYFGVSRGGFMDGYIDDVAVWNRALSETEISMLYNNGNGRSLVTSDGEIGSYCTINSNCDEDFCSNNVCSTPVSPLVTGLVGYWPFSETSGTVAEDLSASGVDGTLKNGVSLDQEGVVGRAFGFDGTNDYISLGNSSLLNYGSSFSIKTRFKTSHNELWKWLVSKTGGSWLGVSYTGYFTWTRNPGNDYISSKIVTNGSWYDGVVTFDNGNLKLYINGEEVGSWTGVALPVTTGNTYIGQRSDNYQYFDGSIDEVAIWNRALTASEVLELYNGGAGVVLNP
jgi:hypothetical protein